jgi:hypothetical protein
VQGRLNIWESLGGKSIFYHDRLIVEVVMDADRSKDLINALQSRCRLQSVQYTKHQ